MKSISLIISCFLVITGSFAQNVGIGTNNPNSSALLDITSTTKGVLLPRMTTAQRTALSTIQGLTVYDTNTNSYWYHNGTAWVNMASGEGVSSSNWVTKGDTTYLANTSGLVGIGTTSPTAPLTINYLGSVPGLIVNSTSTDGDWAAIDIDSKYGDAALRFKRDGVNKWVVRNSADGGSNNFEIINIDGALTTTSLQIDALTGNVGIGKANPAEKLDVAGNAKVSGNIITTGKIGIGTTSPTAPLSISYPGGSGPSGIEVKSSSSTAKIEINSQDGDAILRLSRQNSPVWDIWSDASDNDFHIFDKYGANIGNRLVIKNFTGNVGIGVTDPVNLLDVNGRVRIRHNGATSGIWMSNSINGTTNADGAFYGLINDNTTGIFIGNAWRFQFANNGNMTIAGTLTENSDSRLKKDIELLQSPLEKIRALNGYNYHWMATDRDARLQAGVLAQEVEKQMPELVSEDSSGIKSVNYSGIIPYLIEAVKELSKKNEVLEKEIKKLKR